MFFAYLEKALCKDMVVSSLFFSMRFSTVDEFLQDGPPLVMNGVITPITPVTAINGLLNG